MSITISDIIIKGVAFKKVTVNNESMSTCEEFNRVTRYSVDEKKHSFIISLSSLLGTSIVRILHSLKKKVEGYGGNIYIIADNSDIRELLHLVQVDHLIPVYESEKQFRESISVRNKKSVTSK